MKELKLTIELVPQTSWFSNLRSELSKKDWDKLRKETYEISDNKCDICGGKGKRHPVECHEIWEYDDINKIQTLKGLTSLCPSCHQVKHIGYAFSQGKEEFAIRHFIKINELKPQEAMYYIEGALTQYNERSKYKWSLNLDYLKDKGMSVKERR